MKREPGKAERPSEYDENLTRWRGEEDEIKWRHHRLSAIKLKEDLAKGPASPWDKAAHQRSPLVFLVSPVPCSVLSSNSRGRHSLGTNATVDFKPSSWVFTGLSSQWSRVWRHSRGPHGRPLLLGFASDSLDSESQSCLRSTEHEKLHWVTQKGSSHCGTVDFHLFQATQESPGNWLRSSFGSQEDADLMGLQTRQHYIY